MKPTQTVHRTGDEGAKAYEEAQRMHAVKAALIDSVSSRRAGLVAAKLERALDQREKRRARR